MAELMDRQIRTDIQLQAVARDKEVHLLFSEEDQQTHDLKATYTSNFLLTPEGAVRLGILLADLAYDADASMKLAGNALKAELVERHRVKLHKRLEVILNSTREKRKISNAALARTLVDTCLSDVFTS